MVFSNKRIDGETAISSFVLFELKYVNIVAREEW